MNPPLDLRLRKSLRGALQAGHPWVYRGALERPPAGEAGQVARVFDREGFVAWGLADPQHPIAFRAWSLNPEQPPGPALVRQRLDEALALRRRVVGDSAEAWRVVHGEADGLPGWAIDRYGTTWVVRTDGAAATARLDWLIEVVAAGAGDWAVSALVHRRARGDEGPRAEVLWGDLEPQPQRVREHAWLLEADVLAGQKTGLFLDQRENRRRIFELARGLRVANIFAYNGGFSVAAALGGAARVVSVDISAPAIAAARRNFELNGLDPADYDFAAVDAFAWFDEAAAAGEQFDLIIVDPPSFAPNARSLPAALRAYRRLASGAAGLGGAGALVAFASCSSHVDEAALLQCLVEGAGSRGLGVRLLERRGAGPDHPQLPAFAEGRYLKLLLAQVYDPAGLC